jgi:uncharacterized protein with PIN domain
MVIDTSAVVAILLGEAEAEAFAEAIEATPLRAMSVASALEATIVIESELGAEGGRELDALLQIAGIRSSRSRPSSWRQRGMPSAILARDGIRRRSISATASATL